VDKNRRFLRVNELRNLVSRTKNQAKLREFDQQCAISIFMQDMRLLQQRQLPCVAKPAPTLSWIIWSFSFVAITSFSPPGTFKPTILPTLTQVQHLFKAFAHCVNIIDVHKQLLAICIVGHPVRIELT